MALSDTVPECFFSELWDLFFLVFALQTLDPKHLTLNSWVGFWGLRIEALGSRDLGIKV